MNIKLTRENFYLGAVLLLLFSLWQNPGNFESIAKLLVIFIWLFLIEHFKFAWKISVMVAFFMLLPATATIALNLEVIAVQIGTFIYIFLLIGLIQKIFQIYKDEKNEIQD